ncbi:MAG: hypothetical protein ACFE85_16015 [Candidatus Hodarchaeota archaeon]
MTPKLINNDLQDKFHSFPFDVSGYVIRFSSLIRKNLPSDIYTGNEKIPFKDKHPEFRKILIHEFLG